MLIYLFLFRYGKIRNIDIKTPARPPAFAFITFDDNRDAEDAVRGRDGYSYDGRRLRCEFAKGDRRDRDDRRDDRRDRKDRDDRRRGSDRRRSDFAVQVTNLPRGCSWQDLKDLMRKIGDVTFADANKYGEGTVEFSNREDMDKAIKDLDDTEFKSYNDSSFIRVKAFNTDKSEERRSRSRSRDRRDHSRSRSRDRKHSNSRSHSRSSERRSSSAPREGGRDRERDDN